MLRCGNISGKERNFRRKQFRIGIDQDDKVETLLRLFLIFLCYNVHGYDCDIKAVKSKRDDIENPWLRSVRSSPRTGKPFTWRRNAVDMQRN